MSHHVCLALAGPGARFLGQQTTARGPHWLCKYVLPVAPRARQQPSRSDRGRVAHRAENVCYPALRRNASRLRCVCVG